MLAALSVVACSSSRLSSSRMVSSSDSHAAELRVHMFWLIVPASRSSYPRSSFACMAFRRRSKEPRASGSTLTLLPYASRGDARAISLLLARMGPYLKRAWRGRLPPWVRGRSDTQDLVQEALIRALKHLPRFEDQSIEDFRNWLHAVCRNLVIDETRYAKRKGVEPELPEQCEGDLLDPEERLVEKERADIFGKALGGLSPSERELVVYRLELGCSFKEMADALGKSSADAARMTYNRALKKLVHKMKQLAVDRPRQSHTHVSA